MYVQSVDAEAQICRHVWIRCPISEADEALAERCPSPFGWLNESVLWGQVIPLWTTDLACSNGRSLAFGRGLLPSEHAAQWRKSGTLMEITLADLLTMEPRLMVGRERRSALEPASGLDQVSVSWAVTARTTLPHLPLLRGGELLLLPPRVTAAIGDDLSALIRESEARAVSGIVVAREDPAANATYPVGAGTQALWWDGVLTGDTETDINRLLTECRGNLYRVGTELERRMADAAANQSGLDALVRVASEATGLYMAVIDVHGRDVSAAQMPIPATTSGVGDETDCDGIRGVFTRGLNRGASLVLTPEEPEQRIIARFLIDRIATAANAALQRDVAARPRGSQRANATAELLAGSNSASDQRARALALGLDPDAVYFVAVSDFDSMAAIARALAPLGTAHPAGGSSGHWVTLVAAMRRIASDNPSGLVGEVTARWAREAETAQHSLALSGAAFGVASLPRAAQEAEFVAAMQSVGDVPRRAAAFGSVDDLGAMGLLYQLRESAALRGFIAEALGALPNGDQRGTLRATLRAFLESGGSQVDASRRLGIHRNTLAYRLRRIGDLVGRDVADPRGWLTLHLALRASDMLDTVVDHSQ